jgi:hypothetical protein
VANVSPGVLGLKGCSLLRFQKVTVSKPLTHSALNSDTGLALHQHDGCFCIKVHNATRPIRLGSA